LQFPPDGASLWPSGISIMATGKNAGLVLPLIAATASAREALDLMRVHQRSGVVVMTEDGWRLNTAAHVVVTLADALDAQLIDVPITRLSAEVTPQRDIAHVLPTTAWTDITFESYGPDTDVAALSAAPRDCYCRVDLKPVGSGRTGGDCPYGHHGTVRCV
jgi:hypothetical protein